jgi:hypothetical protein
LAEKRRARGRKFELHQHHAAAHRERRRRRGKRARSPWIEVTRIDLDYAAMREKVKSFSERLSEAMSDCSTMAATASKSPERIIWCRSTPAHATSDLDFVAMDLDLVVRNMEREADQYALSMPAAIIRWSPTSPNRWERAQAQSRAVLHGSNRASNPDFCHPNWATSRWTATAAQPTAAALLKTIEQPGSDR